MSRPVEVIPEIIARLIIRHAEPDSRLATTRAPRVAVRQHGMRADRVARRVAAVVADVGRPLDLVEVGELDPLPQPHVPADPDAGDVEPDVLLERIEVRLTELVEVPDVLPVAVHDVAVDWPSHPEPH